MPPAAERARAAGAGGHGPRRVDSDIWNPRVGDARDLSLVPQMIVRPSESEWRCPRHDSNFGAVVAVRDSNFVFFGL